MSDNQISENHSSTSSWLDKVESLARQIAEREGCRLYDLEFIGSGRGRTLRVFIDREPSVGIDDCSNVSKGLNLLLDVEDVIPGGPYNLEVSTPGLDRHLKVLWHFERVVGKVVWIKSREALEAFGVTEPGLTKAKQFEAELLAVEEGKLKLRLREVEFSLPLAMIEKSKLVFEVEKKSPKMSGGKNKKAKSQ